MVKQKGQRAAFTKKRRCKKHTRVKRLVEAVETIEVLQSRQPEVVRPVHSNSCFNMMLGEDERVRMVQYLWQLDYASAMGELQTANPEQAQWIAAVTKNTYYPTNKELHATKQLLKFESIVAQQLRIQNEHIMPLWTILNSIEAHRTKKDRCT